jgi:hypothetical protein
MVFTSGPETGKRGQILPGTFFRKNVENGADYFSRIRRLRAGRYTTAVLSTWLASHSNTRRTLVLNPRVRRGTEIRCIRAVVNEYQNHQRSPNSTDTYMSKYFTPSIFASSWGKRSANN